MKSRKDGGFAASFPIDDAQCLRELSFEFSYIPFRKNESVSSVLKIADGYLRPPFAHVMRKNFSGELSQSFSPVSIQKPDHITVSVFRKAFDRNGTILRLCEMLGEAGTVILTSTVFREFTFVNMNEEPLAPLVPDKDGNVILKVEPHKIITVLMREGEGKENETV